MPNCTTPASLAARLTDRNIELMADNAEDGGLISTAAVLRDYVRMRKLENAVEDAFVKFAVEYEYRIIENADTRAMGREELASDENWQALKRLLTEAEKGEVK